MRVALSTSTSALAPSRTANTLPTGCAFAGPRVPRPTGPCAPNSETLHRRRSPLASGYGSSLGSIHRAAPRGEAQSIAAWSAARFSSGVRSGESPKSHALRGPALRGEDSPGS
jgi:hypothetical protein